MTNPIAKAFSWMHKKIETYEKTAVHSAPVQQGLAARAQSKSSYQPAAADPAAMLSDATTTGDTATVDSSGGSGGISPDLLAQLGDLKKGSAGAQKA
jgi:hypothetical protein